MQKRSFFEILENCGFPSVNLIFSRFRRLKFYKVCPKKRRNITCFFEHRFGKDLGGVLERFWEAKILDFRSFLGVFSKQKSKYVLEAQKIEKKHGRGDQRRIFRSALRNARPAGERKREGSRSLKS